MRLLQLNLNYCRASQDIVMQSVRELNIDVAVLCEQHRNIDGGTWLTDTTGKAALWSCNRLPIVAHQGCPEAGFVKGEVAGVMFYSCYAPPNDPLASFSDFLGRLVTDARRHSRVAIAGDFNAWATEWGSRVTNSRGRVLVEAFASLDVVLLNSGTVPTFTRGALSSIVDLTFISSGLVRNGYSWKVSEHYTHSDHQAVLWELNLLPAKAQPNTITALRTPRWRGKFEEELFTAALDMQDSCITHGAEEGAAQLTKAMTKACDASMRRHRSGGFQKPPVYWWNEEIAILRKACLRARRLYQRALAKRRPHELQHHQFLEARSMLKRGIRASKKKSWLELCSEVDNDPWGRPYKVVMSKMKGHPAATPTCPIEMGSVVETLFPQHPVAVFSMGDEVIPPETIPTVSREELRRACERVGAKKAPGLDKIPNLALKAAIKNKPHMFIGVYDACLREGVFPSGWKRQRLVLLPKQGKPPGLPSSLRPLCMLDSVGKVFETILRDRLVKHVEAGLSDNQFGFRKGRSTIDAAELAVQTARTAISGTRGRKRYCLIVTLDVKNAFNSARWSSIWRAINNNFSVPAYLRRVIASYFSDRVLWYDTADGPRSYKVTSGVPQGSVLGPMLWNIMYDGLLRLDMPSEVKLVAFADDVAVEIVAKELDDVDYIFHEVMDVIQSWMTSVGLSLAGHKTEAVLVTGRKRRENITLQIGSHNITSQPSIRYLGLLVDQRLSFKEHLVSASKKATAYTTSLSRLMPNIGGPRQYRRALLASVGTSVLMYGAPVWADSLRTPSCRVKAAAAYRLGAIRTICAYRTISYEAVCVIAGMLPVDILAAERRRLHLRRANGDITTSRNTKRREERSASLIEWQERWDSSPKGRWTHRLIPNIRDWVERSHGMVNYHMTQILSNHGCFRSYVCRIGQRTTPECPCCPGAEEDARHVLLECVRFEQARSTLEAVMGEPFRTPEGFTKYMLQSQQTWAAANRFAVAVVTELQRIGNEEKRSAGN